MMAEPPTSSGRLSKLCECNICYCERKTNGMAWCSNCIMGMHQERRPEKITK